MILHHLSAPFDWDRLAQKIFYLMYDGDNATAYLRTRIEAAFVPVDQANDHSMCHAPGCTLTDTSYGLASCGCWDTEIRARANPVRDTVADSDGDDGA